MTIASINTTLSIGSFYYILLFGFFIIRILAIYTNEYTIKLTEIELLSFALYVLLATITYYVTGLQNVSFKRNTNVILGSYSIGLIVIYIWKKLENSFPLRKDMSDSLYFSVSGLLFLITTLLTTYTVGVVYTNSLVSYILYVCIVFVCYTLLIFTKRKEWSEADGTTPEPCQSTDNDGDDGGGSNTDNVDNITLKNKYECNQKQYKHGCCPHDSNLVVKNDTFGSNCRILQKQVLNKNYGIIFWILSLLFVYGSLAENRGFDGMEYITLAWNMFLLGMFSSFSAIYKVEYPLKTVTYNLYPIVDECKKNEGDGYCHTHYGDDFKCNAKTDRCDYVSDV
jgi:hypothetical protein